MFMLNGKLLEEAFPINKIEVFFDANDHSDFLGFTWELVSQGKMPVGLDTNDTDFNTIGNTGGAKTISYTPQGTNTSGAVQSHKLTTEEIPSHSHEYIKNASNSYETLYVSGNATAKLQSQTSGYGVTSGYPTIGNTGGGKSHTHNFTQPTFTGTAATLNNMSPYIVMAFWKRIA